MNAELLAEVIRGETVESIHRGHLYIIDGGGKTVASFGNAETVTFFRSAAKALQAIPFITSGAADFFDFNEKEIALACASHSGEPMHTTIAAAMLEKSSLSEKDLNCGTQQPFHEPTLDDMIRRGEEPTQIHNNCSGKHAAMLAFARHTGADTETYEHLENPVQQEILKTIALFTGVSKDEIKIAVDGCAVPNFALPVSAMARSFVNLVNPPESFDENLKNACRRIVAAKMKFSRTHRRHGKARHAFDADGKRQDHFQDRRGRRLAVRRFAVRKMGKRFGHRAQNRRRRRQTRPRRDQRRTFAPARNFYR